MSIRARAAGILMHPSSLPGNGGIGDIGHHAHRFAKWLADAGMSVWQMLPLGPTGYGNSPYQCFSAFAGNPLLIEVPGFTTTSPTHRVDFGSVVRVKRYALDAWLDAMPWNDEIAAFVETNAYWLQDYAMFITAKSMHNGAPWTSWDSRLAAREVSALAELRKSHRDDMERTFKEQFVFQRQFDQLRSTCREVGVTLMGDLPIYVAHDSADVWARQDLFLLNEDGSPKVQAGVPPDYFSSTGQLWGNPIYNWSQMKSDLYEWWVKRVGKALLSFDLIRLDHFRGFESYWEVSGTEQTAVNGEWKAGPGAELFKELEQQLGSLPIVAEDLGIITAEVEALRNELGFPGMSVLQFAFSTRDSSYLPHNMTRNCVVYSGTHDNDTSAGWWNRLPPQSQEREFALQYLNFDGSNAHWALIRAAFSSVAMLALIPIQDVLGLGSEARMNLPGRDGDNWEFRMSWDQISDSLTERLALLASTYRRSPLGSESGKPGAQ